MAIPGAEYGGAEHYAVRIAAAAVQAPITCFATPTPRRAACCASRHRAADTHGTGLITAVATLDGDNMDGHFGEGGSCHHADQQPSRHEPGPRNALCKSQQSMTSPELADVNVLILTYGAGNKHKDLVDAVTESGVSPRQIVLIHNPDGSLDGARPWAPPDASTLIMPRNVGYGHAMNAGIKFAAERGADWLLLLTHDVQFAGPALTTLLAARERGDGFAVLGPALRRADNGSVYSFGGMNDAKTLVRHVTDEPMNPVDGIAQCLWVDGCAMLVRSAPVIAAGLMRGEFFMYFDEPDLCLRIRRLGWKVGVVTEADARTRPGGFSRPAAYGYLFCRNGLAYALAAGGRTGLLSGAKSQVRLAFRTLLTPTRRDFYRPRHQLTSLSRVAGIGLGFVAFFAGRWGPPPPLLQRLGDIGGTSTPG